MWKDLGEKKQYDQNKLNGNFLNKISKNYVISGIKKNFYILYYNGQVTYPQFLHP